MKKDKQQAQQKANRKLAEKAIKAALATELITLISTFAEPNKKLKKLIGKATAAFAKEINKTAKPLIETPIVETPAANTSTETQPAPKKVTKPRTIKKAD